MPDNLTEIKTLFFFAFIKNKKYHHKNILYFPKNLEFIQQYVRIVMKKHKILKAHNYTF